MPISRKTLFGSGSYSKQWVKTKLAELTCWGKANPFYAIETAVALLLCLRLVSSPSILLLWWKMFGAMFWAVVSFFSLVVVDSDTLQDGALLLVKVLFATAPIVRLGVYSKPHRRIWWVPGGFVLAMALSMASNAITTTVNWAFLVVLSLIGWFAARTRYFWWIGIAPVLLLFHPTLTVHSGPFSWFWLGSEKLTQQCNDGNRTRPRGVERVSPHTRYYGLTRFDATRLLLTGEKNSSWWLTEDDQGLVFANPAIVNGNLWTGSVGDEKIWLVHLGNNLLAVDPGHMGDKSLEFRRIRFPSTPNQWELDYLDVVYHKETGTVFATSMIGGSMWQYSPKSQEFTYHEIGFFYLQATARQDGKIVAIDTTHGYVFDPSLGRVVESFAVSFGSGGLDVCRKPSSELVVADFSGRLRLFSLDSAGHYRFERGVSSPAPRRVAFSPDCEFITVSSADDTTVEVRRRSDLSLWRRYHLGPGLRDVRYLDQRRVGVVDACTVNVVQGGD